MLTLLVSGGLMCVAYVIGHMSGYLMGTKVKNLSLAKPEPKPLDPRKCTCGHHHSSHDSWHGVLGAGGCTCIDQKDRSLSCACQVYIPRPDPPAPKGELEL